MRLKLRKTIITFSDLSENQKRVAVTRFPVEVMTEILSKLSSANPMMNFWGISISQKSQDLSAAHLF